MSMPSPNPSGGPRMSRGIKLVLMGVAGAALLYSCSPGIGAGLGALPYLWFLSNPFYRPPVATPCPPGAPNCAQQANQSSGSGSSGSALSRGGSTTTDTSKAAPSYSQRGGFGATGSSAGSSGTS
jgi:hypothetical protein